MGFDEKDLGIIISADVCFYVRYAVVDCKPVTLVRDLKVFMESGYRVEKGKLMDMFARTNHCEVVVLLQHQEH